MIRWRQGGALSAAREFIGRASRHYSTSVVVGAASGAEVAAGIDVAEAHLATARPVIAKAAPRLSELARMFDGGDGDAWEAPETAAPLAREMASLSKRREIMDDLDLRLSHVRELFAMDPEDVADILPELNGEVESLICLSRKLSHDVLLDTPEDLASECFLEIYAGAGGDDAQSFAEMLVNMYRAWADLSSHEEKKAGNGIDVDDLQLGFNVAIDDWNSADIGIRSARLRCTGPSVFGWLAGEAGVHRLVRMSPFDSSGRRHTSFARVLVFPSCSVSKGGSNEMVAAVDALLSVAGDLRVDTFRSSGKGGQGVNTTDSAVRMTHLPTGIVATYQGERSQHYNRKRCLSVLKSKLAAHIAAENDAEREGHWKNVKETENAFGNQFRSYTLDTGIVNDHRTGFKCSGAADKILQGGAISELLLAGLKFRKLPTIMV